MLSERDFIRRLQQQFPVSPPVTCGIGDDGAVLDCSQPGEQVIVTDMLLDGIHFDLRQTAVKLAGRKAVAVNLSDLAAMGCRAESAFVSIAVPRNVTDRDAFLEELYQAIGELADQYQFTVAGGDTNSWDGPFAINVCLTGSPFVRSAVMRNGALPGDHLYVTGPLGGSLASGRHLTFEPRLALAETLTGRLPPHAMMDISDGLAIDLHRMMEASGTGAIIHADQIPIHADVPGNLDAESRLQNALSDGEDFELLLAMASDQVSRVTDLIASRQLIPVGHVTEAAAGIVCHYEDGRITELQMTGWQH